MTYDLKKTHSEMQNDTAKEDIALRVRASLTTFLNAVDVRDLSSDQLAPVKSIVVGRSKVSSEDWNF